MGKSNNLPSKEYMAGERTERVLHFQLKHNNSGDSASDDSHFIDLSLALSMLNKRAYRQGLYYYIKDIQVQDSSGQTLVKFGSAPDVWTVKQAWISGWKKWMKQQNMVLMENPQLTKAKYADFKIFLNANHKDNYDNNLDVILNPSSSNPAFGPLSMDESEDYRFDEYDFSVYHSMNPSGSTNEDSFEVKLLGTHDLEDGSTTKYTCVSLVDSYLSGRRTDDSSGEPNHLDSQSHLDPLNNLFDAGGNFDEVIQDLEDDNDAPPYNRDGNYVDTVIRKMVNVGPQNETTYVDGFCVPFGLLEVITNSPVDNNFIHVVVTMAAGPYNGVYAERLI